MTRISVGTDKTPLQDQADLERLVSLKRRPSCLIAFALKPSQTSRVVTPWNALPRQGGIRRDNQSSWRHVHGQASPKDRGLQPSVHDIEKFRLFAGIAKGMAGKRYITGQESER